MIAFNGVTITYDAIGNPLTYFNGATRTLTWKNGHQLATYTSGSTSMSFEYNDEGIRTSKTVNGVEHIYYLNGSQIVAEEWGNKLLVHLVQMGNLAHVQALLVPEGNTYRVEAAEWINGWNAVD